MCKARTLDFALIGAQKCATSWLYYCLRDHPEIEVPPKKREDGYIGGELFNRRGEEWFFDAFEPTGAARLRGDVSVDYLYDAKSCVSLRAYMKAPKLIVSLRNPVERCISSYYWLRRCGIIPDGDIDDWILSTDFDCLDALSSPESEIILRGFYSQQLNSYLSVFPPSAFYIGLFENIESAPLEYVSDIYRFLGVDDNFVPNSINRRPKKNSYNRTLIRLERALPFHLVRGVIDRVHQIIAKNEAKAVPVSPDAIKKLCSTYAGEIESLLELLEVIPPAQRPKASELRQRWLNND